MSSRPRGRPRSFDPAQALARAAERFRLRGFSGTSLDELSEATGLNRPSLYAAFGDKRALYLAALRRRHDAQEARLAALADADPPLDEALARLFALAIHACLSGEKGPAGCIAVATATAEATADPEVRDALAAQIAMEDRLLERLLAAAGADDPPGQARLVVAVMQSLTIRARAGATRDELERLARDCIRLVAG